MSSIRTDDKASSPDPAELAGFAVEAIDGHIGTVDEATGELAGHDLVVDTGRWIFKKKRLIPGGVIAEIDLDTETVQTTMTKGQVKHARPYVDPLVDNIEFRPRGRTDF